MPSPDPDNHLSYVIAKVSHQLQTLIDRELSDHSISLTQFSALAHIARSPGLSSAELARAMLTTRQATAGLIRRLADAGLVRHRAVTPGVAGSLYLTDRGRRRLYGAEKIASHAEEEALSSLSRAQREQLMTSLSKLCSVMEHHSQRVDVVR